MFDRNISVKALGLQETDERRKIHVAGVEKRELRPVSHPVVGVQMDNVFPELLGSMEDGFADERSLEIYSEVLHTHVFKQSQSARTGVREVGPMVDNLVGFQWEDDVVDGAHFADFPQAPDTGVPLPGGRVRAPHVAGVGSYKGTGEFDRVTDEGLGIPDAPIPGCLAGGEVEVGADLHDPEVVFGRN